MSENVQKDMEQAVQEETAQEITAAEAPETPAAETAQKEEKKEKKAQQQALDIPIIHVPTLEGMACNAYGFEGVVCPIMDARRSQVYTGVYIMSVNGLELVMDGCAIAIEELVTVLKKYDEKILFIGDGIPVFKEYLIGELPDRAVFAPANMNRQRAASVAILGAKYYEQGMAVPAKDHLPEYFRSSQAEREREAKLLKDNNGN